MSEGPLVSVDWLVARASDPRLRVVDVRHYLVGKRGLDAYLGGHIPGAVFVDLDHELAADPSRGPGRHPLPSADAFVATLSKLGIGEETIVVAYDDAGGAMASRLWWLLRYFGRDGCRLLDGGIGAWTARGLPLETTTPTFAAAPPLSLCPGNAPVVDKAEVVRLASISREGGDVVLLDARARERYEGKSEPIDARAGHIPGARSAPFVESLVGPGGAFLPREALRSRFDALGALSAKTVVCYCGSGVTACHDLLVLSMLGRDDVALYEGSWSDWAKDFSLPLALGPDDA